MGDWLGEEKRQDDDGKSDAAEDHANALMEAGEEKPALGLQSALAGSCFVGRVVSFGVVHGCSPFHAAGQFS